MSDRHPTYITQTGAVNKKRRVPESCIESTETILRSYKDPAYKFQKGGEGSSSSAPPMFLYLKNGHSAVKINVSDSDSQDTFKQCAGLQSYHDEGLALDKLLHVGEGLAIIRTGTASKSSYDMHFLAVLKVETGAVTFSDVSEPKQWDQVSKVPLESIEASSIADLRAKLGSPYDNTSDYSVGVVTLATSPP
jgi:hypothetical protein